MNFLSKNMSFLIISVSTLNYPSLELISQLHFALIRLLAPPQKHLSSAILDDPIPLPG